MPLKLYPHNAEAYSSVLEMLAKEGKAAVVHPTGTGKSFIGFKLCEDNPNSTVLWLSPSEYIFKTQIENLKRAGGEEPENIRFFTYAKLMLMSDEEISEIQPDYIVLDEFHRCGAEMWGMGIKRLFAQYPKAEILGLSATAIRYLDNQRDMADELFDGNVASEITLGDAIVRGILNPPKYVLSVFSYQKDLEKYQRRVRKAKSKAVRDAAEKYLEALRRTLEKADGLDVIFDKHMTDRSGKYIVFCANKEHMDSMMEKSGEWFSKIDKHPHIYSVYSDDPSANRAFDEFKADSDTAHLRLLYCIDALNEGIHVDDVSGVILLRPTVSPIIYKQQIGRALSASKRTDAVIFDVVMNIENLYSIDSVEEEIRVAMTYYRSIDEKERIVNETFGVIDELWECRELFKKLNDTLTASWDTMYEYAKEYSETYGHLDVPKRYKTPKGYSLGGWISAQRQIYHGESSGILDKDRIEKLNAIGMLWDSSSDRSWERFYFAARKYAEVHKDLLVPVNFVTDDGLKLGKWIANLRICRKSEIRMKTLSDKRIRELDAIGMVWDVPDYLWEKNYHAAVQYHRQYGNLNVPVDYTTDDGIRLGVWLNNMRSARQRGQCTLTDTQLSQLDELGMIWEKRYSHVWQQYFDAAKSYFKENGTLEMPCEYVSPEGLKLGAWLCNQREAYRAGKLKEDRKKLLDGIGMVWEKEDSWEVRFALAEEYFETHGHLHVPSSYRVNGINLSKWINEQKQSYRGNRPKQPLTREQIERLESIGIEWRNQSEALWDERYRAVKLYFDEHGDILMKGDCICSDGCNLGEWLKVQREKYRKGTLSEDRVRKLTAVGMI